METILVVSDEPALADILAEELPHLTVARAKPSEAGAKAAGELRLIIADKTGTETISLLEAKGPVLAIARPVRLRELLYTISERLQAQSPALRAEIELAEGVAFSPRERVIMAAAEGKSVLLTEKEADLLTILLDNREKSLARDLLLKQIWGYGEDIDTHTLETHIYRLRGKLRQVHPDYDIAATEEGYRLKLAS